LIRLVDSKEIINLYKITNLIFEKDISINPFSKIIVFEEENIVKGYLHYDLIYDRCEIENIGVLEIYRNKKIASNLICFMINECVDLNYKNITLEVNCNNLVAINLYKKNDFKIIATRKNYYGIDDGYLMMKEIGEINE